MTAMALLRGPDFETLFTSFNHTAWRLEVRESYYEKTELQQFVTSGPDAVDLRWLQPWYALIRSHAQARRRVERVRVVSEPHSDYTRFGLWLAGGNVAAGEDVRYLPRARATELRLPNEDFWLFDSRRLYVLHYDSKDDLLGAEEVTDLRRIVDAAASRDVAWHHATPWAQYAETHGLVGKPRRSA